MQTTKRPLPLVLDTDIGDDIDDALALACALNVPALEMLGVTTVYFDAPRRADLARHFLEVWGRDDLPVTAGCSVPLLQPFKPQSVAQFGVLEHENTVPSSQHAVDYLVQVSQRFTSDNPLTIVTIGALTNIAVALIREPNLAARCRLAMMGGDPSGKIAEWNIACDPEAAAIVFRSGIPITLVGGDVTQQCQLSSGQQEQITHYGTPRAKLLSRLIALWYSDAQRPITLHDPLVLLGLHTECVRFEEKRIEVGLCGSDRAMTRAVPGPANCHVAVEVDATRAVELFLQQFQSTV